MKRALLVGAVLFSTTASAGTYLGLGIGPKAGVDGVMNTDSGGRSARLLGGYSFSGLPVGTLAVEASLTGQSLFYSPTGGYFNAKELALGAKYNYPLGYHFEAFGKAGVHHTWLTHQDGGKYSVYDKSGNGPFVGFGMEYRFALGPVKAGSLFLDYTYYRASLGGTYASDGAAVRMWMLGFTVGL
jgi:hypothetical protein